MSEPSDYQRLARAFGIGKYRKGVPLLIGTGAAITGNPIGFVIAGGVAAGLGAGAVGNRRQVAIGLREVERWGFPVDGYRAWLLANEPTFEIELARDIDPDVFITSVKAIDPSVQATRTRERTFRLVTRRSALPPQRGDKQPVLVGDRELLHLLHERLLAPLHADVGIRRMRMGDSKGLGDAPPLLPAGDADTTESSTEGTSMGAFRDAALAAPPALQALVYAGTERELPHEARELNDRARRVVYALGGEPAGTGTVLGFTVGGFLTGGGYAGPVGLVAGFVGGLGAGVFAMINANQRNARKLTQSVSGHGYPIEGYEDWLLSGRPIFDIELQRAVTAETFATMLEQLPRAWSVSVKAEVTWVVDVTWLDDKLVRVETRPTLIEPRTRFEPFYGGSHAMFETFRTLVLAQLHQQAGIAAVRMGGYLTRRV